MQNSLCVVSSSGLNRDVFDLAGYLSCGYWKQPSSIINVTKFDKHLRIFSLTDLLISFDV